jgi:hypothetical protein
MMKYKGNVDDTILLTVGISGYHDLPGRSSVQVGPCLVVKLLKMIY